MRPIDADVLIKALVRKEPFNNCARVVIAECMEEVRHAPTIKLERETATWIIDSGYPQHWFDFQLSDGNKSPIYMIPMYHYYIIVDKTSL